jgi:hypothetical protein
MRLRLAAAALAATFSLSACAYGGYPGVSVGYGNYGGYNSGYYDPYAGGYSPYGYNNVGYGYGGYGSQYGWYDGYYYPGSGYYVYDQYRRPRVWNDRQRQYWVRIKPQSRTVQSRGLRTSAVTAPNWTGFNRPRQVSSTRSDRRAQARVDRRVQVRAIDEDRDDHRRRRHHD